jgi:hypothetical protein
MRRRSLLLVIILLRFFQSTHCQKPDSLKAGYHVGAAATITNKGISLVPSFTLGKPAVIFDLAIGTRKFAFEPQFRFSLEGKPWNFQFSWRYRLIKPKYILIVGAHPAINFRTAIIPVNGEMTETIIAKRFLTGELSPNYILAKNISIGFYYLYSRGIDEGTSRNTHFITFNANLSRLSITKEYFLRFNPHIYYLRQDDHDGFYFTYTLGLGRRNFPLAISSIINKKIRSDISRSEDFIWNVSLSYSFYKEYFQRK